jgi:hypothetical protein
MTLQWQDELEAKFGLAFTIIDRERVAALRRLRGFGANPWSTGSRFIISHHLLTDETYVAGLRALLGAFRPRALLILDEAHHAAPASGARYAIDSQFTKAVRDLADRFEHRLFLTATPHNGHTNSFTALLEMLDRQRFTRGDARSLQVPPRDLEPVMVRRLKADLRRIDSKSFPKRSVEPIVLDGLRETAAELRLPRMLAAYAELRAKRIARLAPREAANAKLTFVGLQQRLLSSIVAFLRTLEVHRKSLLTLIEKKEASAPVEAARAFVTGNFDPDELECRAHWCPIDGAYHIAGCSAAVSGPSTPTKSCNRDGSRAAKAAGLSTLGTLSQMLSREQSPLPAAKEQPFALSSFSSMRIAGVQQAKSLYCFSISGLTCLAIPIPRPR